MRKKNKPNPTPEKSGNINTISSSKQTGGITAHTVNFNNGSSPTPPEKWWQKSWVQVLGVLATIATILTFLGVSLNFFDKKKETSSKNQLAISKTEINQKNNVNKSTIKTPIRYKPIPLKKIEIRGNGNHTVNGTNNGVNGDVNVSTEKSLTEDEAKNIIDTITLLRKINKIKNNRILFYVSEVSNQKKLSSQLITILKNKSFEVNLSGSGETYNGIKITADSGYYANDMVITILVGTAL